MSTGFDEEPLKDENVNVVLTIESKDPEEAMEELDS